MHGTHYLPCESALLFGQGKRAARVSGSCHVPLARPLFTISPKLRACSKATHSILYGFLFVPNHLLFVSSFHILLFSFPQRSAQRTIIRDDYGKAVSVEGVTSGSRKFALNLNQISGFHKLTLTCKHTASNKFQKSPTDSLTSLKVKNSPLNS